MKTIYLTFCLTMSTFLDITIILNLKIIMNVKVILGEFMIFLHIGRNYYFGDVFYCIT